MDRATPTVSELINVEVAFALPEAQHLVSLQLKPGATAADAIAESRVLDAIDEREKDEFEIGVWGSVVEPDFPLKTGDRVEIYRPLEIDPREARRKLAEAGRTMRQGMRSNSDG